MSHKGTSVLNSAVFLAVGLSSTLILLGYISWNLKLVEGAPQPVQEPLVQFIALFLTLLSVASLSYKNKSITGGGVIGTSISSTFWLGFLLKTFQVYEDPFLSFIDADKKLMWLIQGSLSSVLAFTLIGIFFGLLGYIYDSLFLDKPVEEVFIFRDYWSNVYSMGKNQRREIYDLDQKLAFRISLTLDLHQWWDRITTIITEKKPELLFNRHKKAPGEDNSSQVLRQGDVYDINSGRRIIEDVVDPASLLAKYRPSILEIPNLSSGLGSGRRIALEEMVSRFLGWFINSQYLLYLYISLSLLTSSFIIRYYLKTVEGWPTNLLEVVYLLGSCLIASGLILYFVMRWRRLSRRLYDERPDEMILIFSVYACFVMGFWMAYSFITQPPYINFSESFSASWLVWAAWFLVLSLMLGLSYVFIHRESEVSNIYLYYASTEAQEEEISSYKSPTDEPYWVRDEGRVFWVLRYMYYWPMEITLLPHPDWERIEVWVDAFSGEARWVVSDYHYRELWYKVEEDLNDKLVAGFLLNFHTPIPLVKPEDVNAVNIKLNQPIGSLLGILLRGSPTGNLPNLGVDDWNMLHPPEWVSDFGLKGPMASFCGSLKWSYWRNPWGVDDVKKYTSYPASKPEEQPMADKCV